MPGPGGDHVTESTWVIPGGQEALILDMLGGETGHAGCVVHTASPRGDTIDAEFRCATGGSAHVRVRRLEGPCANACTERFDVAIEGTVPAAFEQALLGTLRAREAEFRYERVQDGRPPAHVRAPSFSPADVAVAIGVVVGLEVIRRRVLGGGTPRDRPGRGPQPAP